MNKALTLTNVVLRLSRPERDNERKNECKPVKRIQFVCHNSALTTRIPGLNVQVMLDTSAP